MDPVNPPAVEIPTDAPTPTPAAADVVTQEPTPPPAVPEPAPAPDPTPAAAKVELREGVDPLAALFVVGGLIAATLLGIKVSRSTRKSVLSSVVKG